MNKFFVCFFVCLLVFGFVLSLVVVGQVSFSDGFETGDLSAWDYVQGSPTVTNFTKFQGNYSLNSSLTSTYVREVVNKSELFVRMYVYWNELGSGNSYFLFAALDNFVGEDSALYPYVGCFDGVVSWGTCTDNKANYTTSSISQGALNNTWYCVEIYLKASLSGQGEIRMWVDGVELTDLHQININTNTDVITDVIVGCTETSYSRYNLIDNVVISDEYIGEYVEPTPTPTPTPTSEPTETPEPTPVVTPAPVELLSTEIIVGLCLMSFLLVLNIVAMLKFSGWYGNLLGLFVGLFTFVVGLAVVGLGNFGSFVGLFVLFVVVVAGFCMLYSGLGLRVSYNKRR